VEVERQAGDNEGSEENRQKTLSGAFEGDRLALSNLEGVSPTGVSATAKFYGVTSRFEGYLDRAIHLERSHSLTVNDDVVRAASDLDADRLMGHS
jgi:hypothetical protein